MRSPWRRGRLRVALAPGLRELAGGTGHGNVWRNVLGQLGSQIRFVDGGRADVWLASGHEPPPAGRPLVVHVYEAAWVDPALRALLDPQFLGGIEAATHEALSAADHVITSSRASLEQLLGAYHLRPGHAHVVPLGVDHEVFRPGAGDGRALVGAPYVLTVAVLHPRKNVAAVRAAVGDLAAAGHPHVLAVVGNLAPDSRAERFAQEDTAELPGHPGRLVHLSSVTQSELVALLAGADVFCLPSLFEGFGLPALEAMACGTPVVVSDRGALPEVVGEAGLVVSPDFSAVSAAVRRVVDDPALADRLRRAAIERAAAFSWRDTAAGWLGVLEQAAGGG